MMRQKILSSVEPDTNGGCWLWGLSLNRYGYGQAYEKGRRAPQKAHRLSYRAFVGEIPDGVHVLHKCDVRCCVNPAHLFIGTDGENARDRSRKGRSASKLSPALVREIYASTEAAVVVAGRLNVSRSMVDHIRNGTRWHHITGAGGADRRYERSE